MNRVGALRATNNQGLQPAIDFIREHYDEAIPLTTPLIVDIDLMAMARMQSAQLLAVGDPVANPMSDKDVLISTGFDSDRVGCMFSKQ